MSYYYKNKYKFSYHALYRAKTRLKLENKSDLEIQQYCTKLILNSTDTISSQNSEIVRAGDSNFYFVIDNKDNVVITLAPLSDNTILSVLES